MQKSKFIRLLETLDKKECKEFEHYLQGLHQKQATAIKIFDYIQKRHPNYETLESDKKKILSKVFPGQDQAAKYLSNSLHDLFRILNDFLLWKKITRKSSSRNFLLLEVYRERKIENLFLAQLKENFKQLQKEKKGDWFYLKELSLHHFRFFNGYRHKLKNPIKALQQCIDSLDLFFLLTKLKYSCEFFNQSNILKDQNDYQFILPLPLNNTIDQKKLPVLFSLYRKMLQLITKGKEEDFDHLMKSFYQNLDKISRNDKANIAGYLINYAISKVRMGQMQFRKNIFSLYQTSLDEKLIIEDGIISTTAFINIVIAGCKLKEFDWLKTFLKNYGSNLNRSSRQDVVKLSQAYILFEKKQFEKVIDLFQLVNSNTMDINFRAKSLKLRCYYEYFGQEEITIQYIKSFENYLNRHKKSHPKSIKAYRNSLKFLKVLFRKKYDSEDLKQKIKDSQNIYFKDWLLEKVEEVK